MEKLYEPTEKSWQIHLTPKDEIRVDTRIIENLCGPWALQMKFALKWLSATRLMEK